MTAVLPDRQPTIEGLLDCCDMLKTELFVKHAELGTIDEQEKELRDFYESLIPREFLSMLDEDVMSPIRCVSSISFFSSNGPSSPRTSISSTNSDSSSPEENESPRNR